MTMAVRNRNPCMHGSYHRAPGGVRHARRQNGDARHGWQRRRAAGMLQCCNTSVCGKSSAETVPYRIDLLMESAASVLFESWVFVLVLVIVTDILVIYL